MAMWCTHQKCYNLIRLIMYYVIVIVIANKYLVCTEIRRYSEKHQKAASALVKHDVELLPLLSQIKRVVVGGRLVPFFKCVCVYFLAMGGGWDPSPMAMAAKCAPVLCLLLVVLLNQGSLDYEKGWYARRIALGLILSALGDALLIWPQHFVAGMAAFAGAHIAYLAAFRFYPLKPLLAPVCYAACAYYMTLISPPEGLKILVPAYAMLLTTMAWRGLSRGSSAAAGAFLFLISDAILGYSLFGGPVQYRQVLVMSTYYLGQLGIALSAIETPRVVVQ